MKINLLTGSLGLLGFLFIGYFFTSNANYLYFIGFFAFLSNFVFYRVKKIQPEGRGNYEAKAFAAIGKLVIPQFFILWCASMILHDWLTLAILIQLFFAVDANLFAVMLYKKTKSDRGSEAFATVNRKL